MAHRSFFVKVGKVYTAKMRFSTLFFDLDGTLYENQTGIWQMVGERIDAYMREEVGIPESEVAKLRKGYLESYGTTLRGLHIHHQVDPEAYLHYVHDIPLEEQLSPNGELDALLRRLPQCKWIFTNASREHALRVLAALDVGAHFQGILDVKDMDYRSKPEAGAYALALDLAGERQAARSVFIDDRAENLAPAKTLGATTVLVGTREPHPAADHSILRIEELLEGLPSLVE